MMLNRNAHQKLSTKKPLIKSSAININTAFITSRNNPKVIIVTGMVRMINKGFKKIFSNARTNATHKAEVKLLICTPGSK